MAVKGSVAKAEVENKIASAFGADFIGSVDKKLYVWAKENGEKVQVAISLTCPKVPVVIDNTVQIGDYNFEDDVAIVTTNASTSTFIPAEVTEEERKNVADLMARLGL